MAISIFENKASDIFAGSPVKAESSSVKATGEEFSKVFEGCVNECVDALKVEGNSEGVKAGVTEVFTGTATSPENLPVYATKAEGERAAVKADTLGGLVSSTVSTVKSTVEASKVEGERAVVKADTLGVLVSSAVSTVKVAAEASKAEEEIAGVKADTLGGLVSSAVSTVKSTVEASKVEGERAGVKADTLGVLVSSAVATVKSSVEASKAEEEIAGVKADTLGGLVSSAVSTVKSSGLEKSVEPDGKIEEESVDEIEEAEEVGKSVDAGHASVLAGAYVQAEKSSPAASPEKAAVKEPTVKSRKTGKEGDKAAELSTQKPSATAPEEKVSAAGNETVKTRAGFVPETLNPVASMKAPVVDKALQEKKITAVAENEAGRSVSLRNADDASEKAGIKAASSDKRVLTGVNTPVASVLTDEYSGWAVDTEQDDTVITQAPEQAEASVEAVKDHKDHPAPVLAPVFLSDELNAGGDTARPVAVNREKALYPAAVSGVSDLSENRDEKGGKGEGAKTATVNGLSHGAQHVNTEKFPVDALSAKPVETVRPEAVFEKLSTGVRMSLAGNGSEVSLSLTPEHLGAIRIKMSIEESSVKARIIVESEAAKTVLDSDSGKLREVFARQGLTLDRYTVELGTNAFSGSSTPFSESAAGENPYGDRSHRDSNGQRTDNTTETKPYRQSENTRRASGGVDLFA